MLCTNGWVLHADSVAIVVWGLGNGVAMVVRWELKTGRARVLLWGFVVFLWMWGGRIGAWMGGVIGVYRCSHGLEDS